MKTEHTPGPWQYSEVPEPCVRTASGLSTVAIMNTSETRTAKANARLIAAAPLMAECLLLIEGAMAQAKDVRGTDRYLMEFTASALNGIRAALDQALGR